MKLIFDKLVKRLSGNFRKIHFKFGKVLVGFSLGVYYTYHTSQTPAVSKSSGAALS